jgi:hypothetical protein
MTAPTSIRSIVADVISEVDDYLSDNPDHDKEVDEYIDNLIREAAPGMTTVLFQLVIEDNALAFEDLEREHDTAFGALSEAVERRVAREVESHLESRREEEDA